ncbi:MAG TPA: energy-coupling factor ABC transporter permease [Ignavibacteria bacterium]
MHIPDGFLTNEVWIPAAVVSAAAISIAVRNSNKQLLEKSVPRLGIISAFIFAVQMINFPVAGGTSGHLLGSALAVALMGPWLASVSISLVLIIQCLLFQDGGVTALGANVFNMAIVGVFSAYFIQKIFSRNSKFFKYGIILSAWFSVVAASFACSLELSFSEVAPYNVVIPAMLIIHSLIGIGEAIITLAVYNSVCKFIPDMHNNNFLNNTG